MEPGLSASAWFRPETVTYASACHAAVVEVDPESGEVRPLEYVIVHDCGRVVNPVIVEGQVVGGFAQGLGAALLEEVRYDPGTGQLQTGSLMDYLVPTADVLPPCTLEHQQTLSPRNALGVKGVGEGGAIAPPAAIANAVEDALAPFGAEIRECPVTPERVREALRRAGAR
jgi:carbon-monoxide dehydrogenase large subunit